MATLMSKPAPGPYSIVLKPKQQGSTNHAILVQDADGRNIATVYGKMNGEKHATSRLFALAPDMMKFIEGVYNGGDPDFEEMERILKELGRA